MSNYANYDPLTHNSVEPMHEPGTILKHKDGVYLGYYKVEDADASQGDFMFPASATGDEMTNDLNASRLGDVPLGVALADIDDGNYGYVQMSGIGLVSISLDSGDFTAGDEIYAELTNDGKAATATIGTHHIVGTAFANSSSSVLAAGAYRLFGML